MAENDCGKKHLRIEDAIHCARTNLGGEDVEPYWGTMSVINPGRVVGYQVSARKRWRLDFDKEKGVHVNEENFDAPPSKQKVVHYVENHRFDLAGKPDPNDLQVRAYWHKWTTRYGSPGMGIRCKRCDNWHVSGRCPF